MGAMIRITVDKSLENVVEERYWNDGWKVVGRAWKDAVDIIELILIRR